MVHSPGPHPSCMGSGVAANLRLKGAVYHFRRRVPDALRKSFRRSEILLSLGTGSAREAAVRARIAYVEVERVFRIVSATPSLAAEQVELILRRLRAESPWDSPTRTELLAGFKAGDVATIDRVFDVGADAILALPSDERQRVLEHLERLIDGVSVEAADSVSRAAHLDASVAKVKAATAEVRAAKAEARVQQVQERAARAEGRADFAEVVLSARAVALPVPVAAPPSSSPSPSPKFSTKEKAFRDWKQTQAGWTAQSGAQAEATFRLLRELIGDKPVNDYSRQHAGEFYDALLRLPSSHGKGAAKGKGLAARDAIARADAAEAAGKTVRRMQLKTVKRHFSALLQCWKWLKQRGDVDELIWSGFDFPGTKSSKKTRDAWSAEDLERLFGSNWWAPDVARDAARWWVPLIALHSGMRLEEICRLRPADVVPMHSVMCFNIREHPDGWTPKTEAGERLVPVHSFLLELGFLEFVERRRQEGASRVFPELRSSGRDNKLGQALGRDFGRLKTGLGIGPKTVFHSFRHTFRTVLESADLEERWIDAVMGHEDPRRSEGARTYAKGLTIKRLAEVVAAFESPVPLERLARSPSR